LDTSTSDLILKPVASTEGTHPTEHQARGRLLTALARAAIAAEFGSPWPALPRPVWLDEPAATFVTLTLHGQLRGCIGSLEARRSLYDDVTHNASAAAFGDPRFPPLASDELSAVRVEVSVLTVPQPLQFSSEADALRRLRPGIDGVILEYGGRRATLLPQVWEQFPKPHDFMALLKQKAGLPADVKTDDVQLAVYQVEKFQADV
jgi:AmmeMemoRadiSam system protein A